MSRLTDNDKHLGPITYGKAGWNPWRLVYSSGGDNESEMTQNNLTVYAFGYVARIRMPNLLESYRCWIDTSKYGWSNNPKGGYWDIHPREYGFSLSDGFFQLFLGPQTHDSITTKSWSIFLPWTQWRFVRKSLYDLKGHHFWTEASGRLVPGGAAWEEQERMREAVPKAVFEFDDYDGKRIKATTSIEEWEWKFGEGGFKWLSIFRRSKVRRCLEMRFSEEVGPEKGSWKGGTCGHSIEMLDGELHEAAFLRYCEEEHNAKGRKYAIKFVAIL